MNKKPGQAAVTIHTGYCPFCMRVRNLRQEERHMGTLVRTTITCETCHRTLSSTMGVAGAEPVTEDAAESPVAAETPTPGAEAEAPAPKPAAKTAPKPRATKSGAAKPQAPRTRARRTQ
jgi:hypothetical protein